VKIHDFQDSLKVGTAAEKAFLEALDEYLAPYPKRAADFMFKATGELVELKSDSYDLAKTENVFMERYSDVLRRKDGGPWQSLGHGVHHYVYFFPRNRTCFWFNTAELVHRLETTQKDNQLIYIPNRGFASAGWKVSRDVLKDLYWEIKL